MSSSSETVTLEVVLAWSYSMDKHVEEHDTEITIAEWNEMSDEARDDSMQRAYDDVLGNQNMGGVKVITPGAKG